MTLRITKWAWIALLLGVVGIVICYTSTLTGRFKECVPAKEGAPLWIAVDLAPGNFQIGENGEITQTQVELVKELLPTDSIVWIPCAHREEAIQLVQKGEANIYACLYPLTATEIPAGLVPTKEVYISKFALIFRADTVDWKSEFYNGDTIRVHIPSSSPSLKLVLKHIQELSLPQLTIVEEPQCSATDLAVRVASGEINYTVADAELAHALCQRLPALAYDDAIAQDMYHAWLLNKKDSVLLKRINNRIQQLPAPLPVPAHKK